MSATLRTSTIHRKRHRHEKRRKLRAQIARATGAEKSGLESKLHKTYTVLPPEPQKATK